VLTKAQASARKNEKLRILDFRNIKVDIITTEEIAEKIAVTVVEKFFKNYAGIVYMHDVSVIRPEKFKS
jgi:hypothetical protein